MEGGAIERLHIVVGTESGLKIEAVRKAFRPRKVEVSGILRFQSRVPPQPVGKAETELGMSRFLSHLFCTLLLLLPPLIFFPVSSSSPPPPSPLPLRPLWSLR